MSRTRKWALVAQEAGRLAGIGLSQREIAERLEVSTRTVKRWMKTGKLPRRPIQRIRVASPPVIAVAGQTPTQWANSIRRDYQLDATDDQLVTIAETALALSLDSTVAPHVRMNAAGRFQAIVRQLALVARRADQLQPDTPASTEPERKKHPVVERSRTDPRVLLMAVK